MKNLTYRYIKLEATVWKSDFKIKKLKKYPFTNKNLLFACGESPIYKNFCPYR